MNFLIFHGTAGFPEENWFPWLKKGLEGLGHAVYVPRFPTPSGQTLENWFAEFEKYKKLLGSDTLIIGHSLGGAFALRVIERSSVKIKAAILVATPIGVMPIKNFDSDRLFLVGGFDWQAIRENCGEFSVFHSKDDPLVSFGNGVELSKNLGAKFFEFENAGHFNSAAGYKKFPELLRIIKKSAI